MTSAQVLCPGGQKERRGAEIPHAFRADSPRGREENCQWRGVPERKGGRRQGSRAKGAPLTTEQFIRPMSEPRLPETRSSRDIAPVGHAALRELAVKVLAQHSGSDAGAEALATAARRAYDDLVHVSTPLIGQIGVDALTARALHLAQQEYPWLVEVEESADAKEPFARVLVNLRRQQPIIATEGTAAVFASFAGLLVTFIGEPLTTALLRKAWPNAFSDARTEER